MTASMSHSYLQNANVTGESHIHSSNHKHAAMRCCDSCKYGAVGEGELLQLPLPAGSPAAASRLCRELKCGADDLSVLDLTTCLYSMWHGF